MGHAGASARVSKLVKHCSWVAVLAESKFLSLLQSQHSNGDAGRLATLSFRHVNLFMMNVKQG